MDEYQFCDYYVNRFCFPVSLCSEYEAGMLKCRKRLNATISGCMEDAKIKVSIQPNSVNKLIDSEFEFDACLGSGDRLLLYSLPEETNVDIPVMFMLKSSVRPTRDVKNYTVNEPVVGSIFTDNGKIVKVSFTMANPERLIEFEGISSTSCVVDVGENEAFRTAQKMARLPGKKVINFDYIEFVSNILQRFDQGIPRGLKNMRRKIIIKKNINGCEGYDVEPNDGYIVSVLNLDGIHPVWGNNVQVAPKPMRLIRSSTVESEFRGFNCLANGPFGRVNFSGSDYGLIVEHPGNKIEKCVLYMFDRDAYIEYYE